MAVGEQPSLSWVSTALIFLWFLNRMQDLEVDFDG